jgi:predicted metal-dependent hydrolase
MNIEASSAWTEAVQLFNRGAYWDCHEALEPLWHQSLGLERSFLAGVILLAAALHKARVMGSRRGGRRNYAKALRHLALVPDSFAMIDVRELEAQVHQALRDEAMPPQMPTISKH